MLVLFVDLTMINTPQLPFRFLLTSLSIPSCIYLFSLAPTVNIFRRLQAYILTLPLQASFLSSEVLIGFL